MRIQIASDVHRELDALAPYDVADVGADLVILAGDTDRGGAGVSWAARTWTKQPVVRGMGMTVQPKGRLIALDEPGQIRSIRGVEIVECARAGAAFAQ